MTTSVTNIVREIRRYLEERYSSGDVRIITVEALPSFGEDRSIRVSWEYRGVSDFGDYRNLVVDIDSFAFMGRSEIDTAIYIAREFTRGIEEDRREFMAQWNRRRSQQLQDQERQRREARGQADERVEFRPQPIRPIGTRIADVEAAQRLANTEYLRSWFQDEVNTVVGRGNPTTYTTATTGTNAFIYNTTNGIGGIGGAGGTASAYERNNTLTFNAAEELFKRLLQEKLDSLDIRISLDESDGEVSAEVEVSIDGKVIASDSDSITIG